MNIGDYILYKDVPHIIVDTVNLEIGEFYKLLNPLVGNDKVKVKSSNRQLKGTRYPRALMVEHKGNDYIVTRKGLIISYRTGKVMRWGEDHGMRKSILAGAQDLLQGADLTATAAQ